MTQLALLASEFRVYTRQNLMKNSAKSLRTSNRLTKTLSRYLSAMRRTSTVNIPEDEQQGTSDATTREESSKRSKCTYEDCFCGGGGVREISRIVNEPLQSSNSKAGSDIP